MDKFCIRVGASASSNSSAVASIAAQPEANASSSSAAQPARSASASASSAAQPAVQLKSINDVKRWLSTFAEHEPDEKVKRIMAAVGVLTRKPHPRKEEVHPLCPSWSVQRQINVRHHIRFNQ